MEVTIEQLRISTEMRENLARKQGESLALYKAVADLFRDVDMVTLPPSQADRMRRDIKEKIRRLYFLADDAKSIESQLAVVEHRKARKLEVMTVDFD
jgi:hypothetical protein